MDKKKKVIKKVIKNAKKVKKVIKTTNDTKKTHVAIILDKSGSMSRIKEETISSFNEQVKTIKKSAKGSDTYITLTLFDDSVTIHSFAQPIETLKEITDDDYKPSGYTAMYDAIGMTVERMKKEIDDINDKNTAVLCIIITDGAENASKKWFAADIASLVKRLTETKRWTFSVLGANIDLAGLSEKIGIAKSNMAKFSSDKKGIMRGTAVTAQSVGRYFGTRLSADSLEDSEVSLNFYSAVSDEITDTTEPEKND